MPRAFSEKTHFGQVPFELLGADITHGAFRLYAALCMYADFKGIVWPTVHDLSIAMGKCERSIKKWLKELREAGLIARKGRHRQFISLYIPDECPTPNVFNPDAEGEQNGPEEVSEAFTLDDEQKESLQVTETVPGDRNGRDRFDHFSVTETVTRECTKRSLASERNGPPYITDQYHTKNRPLTDQPPVSPPGGTAAATRPARASDAEGEEPKAEQGAFALEAPSAERDAETRRHNDVVPPGATVQMLLLGHLDGLGASRLAKSQGLEELLVEHHRAESHKRWGYNRTVRAQRTGIRKVLKLIEQRSAKPSEVARAVTGMCLDEWPDRFSNRGWTYVAKHFDRWLSYADTPELAKQAQRGTGTASGRKPAHVLEDWDREGFACDADYREALATGDFSKSCLHKYQDVKPWEAVGFAAEADWVAWKARDDHEVRRWRGHPRFDEELAAKYGEHWQVYEPDFAPEDLERAGPAPSHSGGAA